jgi:hypothetical protein
MKIDMTKPASNRVINRILKDRGMTDVLVRDPHGYYYFHSGDVDRSIYVYRISDLTLAQVMDEYDEALASAREDMKLNAAMVAESKVTVEPVNDAIEAHNDDAMDKAHGKALILNRAWDVREYRDAPDVAAVAPKKLTHFLAVGAGCWGREETIRGAIKIARQQGASSKTFFNVWLTPSDAQVDGMGYIRSGADDADPIEVGKFDAQSRAK